MHQELEITADLTKEHFDAYLAKFTKQLGQPVLKRRIAFMIIENNHPLDNRVKITNGQAMLVQKIKTATKISGERSNQEIEIPLPNTLEAVKKAIKMLENFYTTFAKEPLRLIVQQENYLWITDEFELKITRQFGKSDIYVYEIESLGAKSPAELQSELGIQADYETFSPERIHLRRAFGDIHFNELNETEFDALILKYLAY